MRHRLITILIALCGTIGLHAAQSELFPYPTPPDDMELLGDRCDYIVGRFWDRCNLKSAFSSREKLNKAFGDWVAMMPYATADTVHAAIDRLLASTAKNGKQTLELARMAEGWAYSDSSMIYSEEIYYPFAKAAATHRKISGADKARFIAQVQIMDNTRIGQKVGHLDYELLDGSHHSLDETRTQIIVLFFNDHECDACALARLRLSANVNAMALQRAGLLTVISIEPAEMNDAWRTAVAGYPPEWINCVAPDADEYFSLRTSPSFFLLDSRHRLLAKNFDIEGLLAALAQLRTQSGI